MTDKFHAILKARGDNTMELLFDGVEWAGAASLQGVEVEIVERDKSLGRPAEPSRDDALGTVIVDLAKGPTNSYGRPSVQITRATFAKPINPARIDSGHFTLKAGDQSFDVSVFMDTDEWPHDAPPPWAHNRPNFVELGLRVRFGGSERYSNLGPGFRPDRLGSLRGPVLTYIIRAAGAGDIMADNAAAHWAPRSDRLVRPSSGTMSLAEVLEDLGRDATTEVTWKQVNIVTHGNLSGLFMPLKRGEATQELTAEHLADFEHPTPKGLDRRASHIVIRGCAIGRDRALLKALSGIFGGCKVYAPNTYLIAYHRFTARGSTRTRELLYRRYWAFAPGTTPRTLSPAELAKLLQSQVDTMPMQPRVPFSEMVSKPFDGHASGVPAFFRRSVDVDRHAFDFPKEGDVGVRASALQADPELRTGMSQFRTYLASKDGLKHRAQITQPDHTPLPIDDPMWNDIDAWKARGHWSLKATNLIDHVVDPKDPDPTHNIRAQVVLSRRKFEACELEGEITDVDVTTHPGFGSSH